MTAVEPALAEAIRRRQSGDWNRAAAICADILARRPDDPAALQMLGMMAFEAGRPDAALELLRHAVAAAPGVARLWTDLGRVLRSQGCIREALECFRCAAELEPQSAEAQNNVGNALRELGLAEQALAPLERALELRPDFPEAVLNLAGVLEALGRLDEAAAHLSALLERNPDFAEARTNLGNLLARQGRLHEALRQLERAVRNKPGLAAAWNNLGAMHERLGDPERAIACYREAVRLDPCFAEAHLNLGMASLLLGRFQQGWLEYEWRLRVPAAKPSRFSKPLWDGSGAQGLRILLTCEQGLGDAIQFVRYVPLLAERGAVVYLECHWRLAPLLKSVRGLAGLVPAGSAPPSFDAHLPLMSLPRIFGTDLETIPAEVPYLGVPPEQVARWRAWIEQRAGGLRVGLCWASNASGKNAGVRSMQFKELAPLFGIPGIVFFSLQRGPGAAEIAQAPPGWRILDLEAEARGILDTAAAILSLDLVISVDTMVAHLAGALARPVWTLLPFAPDFRWLRDRTDSPWYPTMRLFRQPAPGQWSELVEQVAGALAQWRASSEVKRNAQHG